MESIDDIYLEECPTCGGVGLLEEDCGQAFDVSCIDCGSHTVPVAYKNEADKYAAAANAAKLWNMGKVITSNVGD